MAALLPSGGFLVTIPEIRPSKPFHEESGNLIAVRTGIFRRFVIKTTSAGYRLHPNEHVSVGEEALAGKIKGAI